MILLIDGDFISYRCSASCEPTKAKPFLEDKDSAIFRANSMMEQLMFKFNTEYFRLFLAGSGNWRYNLYPEYKANRKDKIPPTYLQDVREFLVSEWKAKLVNDREVDDECGIELTAEGLGACCVSIDKDLLQIPGNHYNFIKDVYTTVSPLDGLRNFYRQVVTGDASDNVPAFDGLFRTSIPKKIDKILAPLDGMDNEEEMYNYCREVYRCLGTSWEETMNRNASVLYIQRREDDYWRPPGLMEENELLL